MQIKIEDTIPKCIGNRYVISDIHGCFLTFKSLVSKLNLTNNDQLFLLGDYIDRGPSSIKVLDYIINLSSHNNVYSLMGSHEYTFLLYREIGHLESVKKIIHNKKYSFVTEFDKYTNSHIEFMKKLPYYFELDDYMLVHAGFNFEMENPYGEFEDMVFLYDWEYSIEKAKNKTIIHGHKTNSIKQIQEAIQYKQFKISIDNGCFSDEIGLGNLVCLNLDTFELITQKRLD